MLKKAKRTAKIITRVLNPVIGARSVYAYFSIFSLFINTLTPLLVSYSYGSVDRVYAEEVLQPGEQEENQGEEEAQEKEDQDDQDSPASSPAPEPTPEPSAEPIATPESTPEPTLTPESTPTPEPTSTPESEPSPTPSPTEEPVATPTPEPTPIIVEPTPTPTPTPVDPAELPDILDTGASSERVEPSAQVEKVCAEQLDNLSKSVDEDWSDVLDDEGQLVEGAKETKDAVKLGVKYEFPLENKVSVTFKCLPADEALRKPLRIQQIKVSDLNLPDGVNVDGEYAYDITTDMEDGTFEYDVTLPKSEGIKAEVIYIEKTLEEAKEEVKADEIKLVEETEGEVEIEQEVDKAQINISGLDHFTTFIVIAGVAKPITQITTCDELQAVKDNLSGAYSVMNDIDCSATSSWNGGEGFVPIGNSTNKFTGTLDGNNYSISSLYINRNANYQGLFGYVGTDGVLANIKLINVNITGQYEIGGLVGRIDNASIRNCHTSGVVNASGPEMEPWGYVGGLAGYSHFSSISNSSSTANVNSVGGTSGGLVGYKYAGTLSNSYARGNVTGSSNSGGLAGFDNGTTTNSYSTGTVACSSQYCKGLVGKDYGSYTANFWDRETSGKTNVDAVGRISKTTAEMKTQSTFTDAGWDFTNIWAIDPAVNDGYPYLAGPTVNSIGPTITTESATNPTADSVTITWTTDHPATSRVIYDTVSHSSLGTTPNYGYAHSTTEDATLVTSHSVTVSGLSSATEYYFRAVSHGSPESVSEEITGETTKEELLKINEIDYDQPSTDDTEFIELKNIGQSSVNLNTYELRLIDGGTTPPDSYRIIDLPNVELSAGEYYVVCGNSTNVSNCDLVVTPSSDLIQDGGPDAVALFNGSGPTGVLADTVSYEGDTVGYTEATNVGTDNGSLENMSFSRFPDGQDTNDNSADFILSCISPGLANTSDTDCNKVTICHSTSSHANPYNSMTPNKSADVQGHDGHDGGVYPDNPWGDIIPPFYYFCDSGICSYPGKNWTVEGQAIWNNDCNVTEENKSCGDGIVDGNEQCDYGDLNGQSSCSDDCTWIYGCLPEMIANGSFETPVVDTVDKWDVYDNGEVPGWTAEWYNGSSTYDGHDRPDPQTELHRGVNGWNSADGSQHVELDTDWTGPENNFGSEPASITLSQQIPTIEGYIYKLSWSYSPRPDYANNHLQVKVGDVEVFDSGVVAGGGSVDWKSESRTFTATSNLTTISFTELGLADSYGMFLDKVSVECEPDMDVTVCKGETPVKDSLGWLNLPNWRLYLLGEKIDSFDVPSDGSAVSKDYPVGSYAVLASGTYNYGDSRMIADVANSYRYTGLPCSGGVDGWVNGDFVSCMNHYLNLNPSVSGGPVVSGWGNFFNPGHVYAKPFSGGDLDFKIWDSCSTSGEGCYGDNEGSLKVDVYEGYVGDTDETGCITFEDVPYGTYEVGEILQDGWTYDSGAGELVVNDKTEMPVTIFNSQVRNPAVEIDKTVSDYTPYGSDVVYSYTVTNTGDTNLTGVTVSDDKCSPVAYVDGDTNGDSTLQANEVWNYTCSTQPTWDFGTPVVNTAQVDANYRDKVVTDTDTATLYPVILNKNVFIRGDEQSPIDDVTKFDVEISKNQSVLDTVSVGYGSPVSIWLGEGDYTMCEINLPSAYENDGCVAFNGTTSQDRDIVIKNYRKPVTLVASKIVCDSEGDLPNWGTGGPDITATTAQEWVNSHPNNCRLVSGWEFEYGPRNSGNPGDTYVGQAGGKYSVTSPTNELGVTTAIITDPSTYNGVIEMREVLQSGYLPFSYGPSGSNNSNDISAEFYCASDVLNYDNWDWINNPQYGQTYYCVAWNVPNGSIHGYKWNDADKSGGPASGQGEELLSGWTVNLYSWNGDGFDSTPLKTKVTSDSVEHLGWYWFENLHPGKYKVCEVEQSGWMQTYPLNQDDNCHVVTLPDGNSGVLPVSKNYVSGPEYNFGNTNKGTVTVYKFNDLDGDGSKSPEEPTLPDWDMVMSRIEGSSHTQKTDNTGKTVFDLASGEYVLSENTQSGWVQTGIYCEDYVSDSPVISGDRVLVEAGQNLSCYVGNYIVPRLTIAKWNDVVGNEEIGNKVLFTIRVTAHDNDVLGTIMTDLFSKGFKYVLGSWTALSDKRGDLKALGITPEPAYASPGDWDLGDMEAGEVVTLSYLAEITDEVDPGTYKDLAWAQGRDLLEQGVLATAEETGYVAERFVGTEVPVVVDEPTQEAKAKVKTTIEKEEVLGVATELPATGSNTLALLAILALLGVGIALILNGLGVSVKKKSLAVLVLSGLLISLSSGSAHAGVTPIMSVRLEKPESPVNGPFKLTFVAMEINGLDMSAKCLKKYSSDADFSQFGSTIAVTSGGNTYSCDVDESVLIGDGTYEFKVEVSAGGETEVSNTESIVYDGDTPGKPKYIEKDKKGDCKYEVTFKTADDGGETAYVEIYRDDDKEFTVSDDKKIKTVTIGSDEKESFDDELYGSECAKTPYYAIRAFNSVGTPSSVRAEEVTKTEKVTVEGEGEETAGAIAVVGGQVAGEGAGVGGAEVVLSGGEGAEGEGTTGEGEETPEVLGETEENGGELGGDKESTQTGVASFAKPALLGLGILGIILIIYASRKKKA